MFVCVYFLKIQNDENTDNVKNNVLGEKILMRISIKVEHSASCKQKIINNTKSN